MNILHISTAQPWRGGEQQVAYLASELNRRTIGQLVMCPVDSALHLWCKANTISVKTYRKGLFYRWIQAFRLSRLCRMTVQPVVHVHDSHSHTIALIAAILFMNKTPVVVHRRVAFRMSSGMLSVLKYEYPAIKAIVCVSRYVKEIMEGQLRRKEHLVVIHDAVDKEKFRTAKSTGYLAQTFHFSSNPFLVGNLSALTTEKDIFTFIDTARYVVDKEPDTRFFIIGEGPLRKKIEDYIEAKMLGGKVFLTGFLSNIPEVLPELDLCMTTSRNEGLGTSLLDAFACRVPVVATETGGIVELVKNNHTGLTAPAGNPEALANAVLVLMKNPELREKLVQNAYDSLEEFSIEVLADKILKIYESTCCIDHP